MHSHRQAEIRVNAANNFIRESSVLHYLHNLRSYQYIILKQFLLSLHLQLTNTNTHTHTRLTALCPGLPRWAGTRKVKPIWILLKQETVGGSGISWAICKPASCSRQITMPVPHHSRFLQAGCPSCCPLQQHNTHVTASFPGQTG